MPRELLMMQNSFQWGTAEGQTLEIENAIRSNVRDLKIEGQTYQNLSISSSGKTTMTSGGFVYLFNSTNGADMIKLNTTYTLIIDIKDAYYTSNNFGLLTSIEYLDGTSTLYIALTTQTSGRYVRTFTFKNPVKNMNLGVHNSNTSDCYCDMSSIMLLEGDYTNIDIPDSINEIESVAEREKEGDLYPIKVTQSNNETDGITLPNGVKNSIENGKHIKRVGKFTIDGTTILLSENNLSLNTIRLIQPVNNAKNAINERELNFLTEGNIPKDHSAWSNDMEGIFLAQSYNRFILRVNRDRFTEINQQGFINYFSSNPITLYYELATPITEPLTTTEIPLPQPLRSLPNGVCDEVVGNKLIQRIGKYIITGNEYYELRYQNDAMFTIQCGDLSIQPTFDDFGNSNVKMICDKAVCKRNIDTTFITDKLTVCGRSSIAKGFVIAIPKKLLTEYTIDKAKEYIKSLGEMIVYYELATPIEHTINIPPISISKGINMVTTNNNIKPELTFKYKYKQSTKIIKYLYNSGNEYLNITGGWNTQLTAGYGAATTIVKNTNNIYFPTGVWNMLLTNNKIDVTNYDVVYMKYSKEYISFNGHPARCAIKLGNKNTSWTDFANDATTGALIGKNETENNVTNGILTIDVSNVTGSYYVGIGGQSNNITVHEIGLKKDNGVNSDTTTLYSNGNENTSLTGGYLTSSNSATCNIEKQVDNLYVNCTGKTSFDSICYARTNNYIKPCKIKVSVKNNSISANGVAFCVFLSEKEAINSVSDFDSVVNKGYIKASNTTQGQYVDLEIDLTNNTRGYLYIACMIAGSNYDCKANISKIEIIK